MNALDSLFFWTTMLLLVVVSFLTIRLYYALKHVNKVKMRDDLSKALEWPFIEDKTKLMVRHCRRYQEKLSFLMIDGDDFRKIFDVYGLAAGNEAFTLLGKAVRAVVRDVDLFGKYASGKFIVCLPNTDLNGAVIVAERIRQTIAETKPSNYPLHFTISIGCCELQKDEDMEQGIARANQALERAKTAGGDQVSSSKNREAESQSGSTLPNAQNLQ